MASSLLTGCWDRVEIDERAVVLGVSIDKAAKDEEEHESEVTHVEGSLPAPVKDMVHVAVQIALPGRIPLGPGESGGASGNPGQTLWVVDVFGHSIDDAFMNLQQQISSKLFFGHLRVIVISEEVARRGLANINDFFRRNSEVRRMAWLMVSKGKALDLMKAAPKLERIPTLYLMSTLDEGIKMGKFPKDYIGIFWSNMSKKGQEGFLPYIELKKSDNVEIKGLAYFRGEKMVGATKPLEIAGYLGLKGINPAGYRAVITIDNPPGTVITNVAHRSSKIEVRIKKGNPHFTIDVMLEVNVEEVIGGESLTIDNPSVLTEIEKKQDEASVKFYEDIIKKTQQKKSDIFGFGEYVRAKEPGYWKRHIGTKEQWEKQYPDATFDVHVVTKIRRIGMKAK
ncbi:Ger(x)C family spore germination protein [Paenibacillus harenae]|uniref:Spore germination protein KC n=1 Tax=Paenibacillus harenae TaxID=306543 RepID=A0ABT9TYQ8_PAEHA|nr:Ger(x)C family spore germination protein [Paenibacillus harenae]MDQ0111878.1 spore germination protein KC [Paenibacillus harenae]